MSTMSVKELPTDLKDRFKGTKLIGYLVHAYYGKQRNLPHHHKVSKFHHKFYLHFTYPHQNIINIKTMDKIH